MDQHSTTETPEDTPTLLRRGEQLLRESRELLESLDRPVVDLRTIDDRDDPGATADR